MHEYWISMYNIFLYVHVSLKYTQLVIGGFILVLWFLIFLSFFKLLGFKLSQFDSIWLNLAQLNFYFLGDKDFRLIIKELKLGKPLIVFWTKKKRFDK